LKAIQDSALVSEDIFICNNTSIHLDSDTIDLLQQILQMMNIRMELLLAYSPKLNLAELVFSESKLHSRIHQNGSKKIISTLKLL
jgi:hypothetical protein